MNSSCSTDITGIILAGGLSSRFGSPKAFARYKDQLFYEHALNALSPHVRETVIVSSETLLDRFSFEKRAVVITDAKEHEGKGPLAGIYSVMKIMPNTWYFVLPCDMPLMDSYTAGKIASYRDEEIDAVIPQVNGRIQPLAGLYNKRVWNKLGGQLNSGDYRMMRLLDEIEVRWLDAEKLEISPELFQNVNDHETLNRLSVDRLKERRE